MELDSDRSMIRIFIELKFHVYKIGVMLKLLEWDEGKSHVVSYRIFILMKAKS
jgi:hypothetical protein